MGFIVLDTKFHALNPDQPMHCTTAKLWSLSILSVDSDENFLLVVKYFRIMRLWWHSHYWIRICTTKELHKSELAVVNCLSSLTITLTSQLHTLALEWRWCTRIYSSTFQRNCKWVIYIYISTTLSILCVQLNWLESWYLKVVEGVHWQRMWLKIWWSIAGAKGGGKDVIKLPKKKVVQW